MLSTTSTQTDSMKSKEAYSMHVLSLYPPAQRQPDRVSPRNGMVDTRPSVTPHHISKPERGLSHGDAKPAMERRRQKQTTRMSTGRTSSPRRSGQRGLDQQGQREYERSDRWDQAGRMKIGDVTMRLWRLSFAVGVPDGTCRNFVMEQRKKCDECSECSE